MRFVIGDIHGEITKLKHLVEAITKRDKVAELIFIGDYLDKGENPLHTLRYIYQLKEQFNVTLLWGNHEFSWLNLLKNQVRDPEVASYLLGFGGKQTIRSFGEDNIFDTREKLIHLFPWFFGSLIPHLIVNNYVITHSGLSPDDFQMDLDNIPLDRKIFNRYDFIQENSLFLGKYKFIFGHTGFYSPYVNDFKIGIDTAACFLREQPLTSFCVDEETFINSEGKLLKLRDVPNNYCPCIPRNRPWRENED